MHGPILSHLILVVASVVLAGSTVGAASPTAPQRVADAKRALSENHPVVAIGSLDAALLDPSLPASDKQVILGMLRQAYETAADQAEAAGRPTDAESYRENARILRRKTGAVGRTSTPASTPTARPVAPDLAARVVAVESSPPVVQGPTDAPLALPDMTIPDQAASAPTEPVAHPSGAGPAGSPMGSPDRLAEPKASSSRPDQNLLPASEPTSPGLAEADAAFRAKRYAEAGLIYEALAQENLLPIDRREHWGYCRSAEVARRINAKPKTEAEWQSIDAEIKQIRALAPDNYLGVYLQNRASDRPSARKSPKAGSTVVRAASPEEAPLRSGRTARPASAPTSLGGEPPAMANGPVQPGVPVGRWQIRESANFRVLHADPKLAEKVVQVAESVRREQTKRWSGSLPQAPWQPKCEIYLYPSAQQYAQMTGQPDDSPGFSTMGMNQGEIISRRVNLRTDHAGLLAAVLPHEVTHVILADFFKEQQIPRWADEGMAVLTEPVAEQKRREADLIEPLGRNLLFTIDTLMKMDYPDNRYWSLYYAQSVSLTSFLVAQGTGAQFIDFLQGAQANGYEAELRRVYNIDGYADLQARWVAHARANLDAAPTATASNASRSDSRSR